MAPHSSTLAWKISLTEDPGRLQSMGGNAAVVHFLIFPVQQILVKIVTFPINEKSCHEGNKRQKLLLLNFRTRQLSNSEG